MQDFSSISKELFNKIRGRFPSVTIGDEAGKVTNEPELARFFDFEYTDNDRKLGNVSVSLSEEDGLTVIYSKSFVEDENTLVRKNWFNFLKELRVFSKKRMMEFDVRDINKSNLTKRDYKFLSTRAKDETMNEAKLYGTSMISYQNIGEARLVIKHTESVNQELATGRTQKIGKIYIESADGERFLYPYKHLSGARAMARHVAEGGKPFDDFGNHIVGLSEEMSKLRKFKNYVGRSAVMAESLEGYMDIVKDRISTVKKTIESLQKPNYYAEAIASYETPVFEEVPDDVRENWVDELTIKQFNEELQDVFPYIYNLVKEGTKARELTPEEMEKDLEESGLQYYIGKKKYGKEGMRALAQAGREGASEEELGKIKDKHKKTREEIALEQGFDEMMGQFAEGQNVDEDEVRNFLRAFDDVANDMNVYGDVNPETVIRHLEQGDVESAIETVTYQYAGPDGEEPGRGWNDLVDELEADFRYIVDGPEQDGQPDFDQEYDDDPMDDMMDSIEEESKMDLSDKEMKKLMDLGDKQYQSLLTKYLSTENESSLDSLREKITQSLEANGVDIDKASDMFSDTSDRASKRKYSFWYFITNSPLSNDETDADKAALTIVDRLHDLGEHLFFAVEENIKEDNFDKNFQKRIAAKVKGGAGAEYMKKKADQYKQQNRELDPGAAEKGLGIGVLDAKKAYAKAKKKGAKFPSRGVTTSPNTRDPKRLPEAEGGLDLPAIGRILMDKAIEEKDDERSQMMSIVGDELTKYGTNDGARSPEQLVKKTGASMEQIQELVAFASKFDDTSASKVPDPEPEMDTDEGNAYAHAVRKAKMDGKKKGDKVDGPDGDEITLEKEDKVPVTEFILSLYDRETGVFPKGETAVLTAVEKDYGEEFIEPAKAFIEQVNHTFEQYQARQNSLEGTAEFERMKELAGLR